MKKVSNIKTMLQNLNTKSTKAEENGNGWKLRAVNKVFKNPIRSPRLRVKCGCCDQTVDIYYDPTNGDGLNGLEINGVNASIEEWRRLLLPLLKVKSYED